MSVPAIILAAGASKRLGEPKQLLKYHGERLLARADRIATECEASPVFIVLGANAEIICASMQFRHAALVINDQWQRGMATSIHAGLRALDVADPRSTGVLLMSCDQPLLTADHLRSLIQTFKGQTVPGIVCSSYAGIFGVPAIFPRDVFSQLEGLEGDQGARALLASPPCPLIMQQFPGGEIDIDCPEDLIHLK